jgi:hypothetical protein
MTNAQKARKLLKLFGTKGQHWTTEIYAKTKGGKSTHYTERDAHQFCLIGACWKLHLDPVFLDIPIKKAGFTGIVSFNDHDGFAPIKNLLLKIAGKGVKKVVKSKTRKVR